MERVAHWASTAFATPSLTAALAAGAGRGAPCALISLRDGHRLWLHARHAAKGGRGATPGALRITLRCAEIALAARIVQDLATSLQLSELESRAAFPSTKADFVVLARRVKEQSEIRLRLTSEMADSAHLVKGLVVRAEDARMLGRMKDVRAIAAAVFRENEQLLAVSFFYVPLHSVRILLTP